MEQAEVRFRLTKFMRGQRVEDTSEAIVPSGRGAVEVFFEAAGTTRMLEGAVEARVLANVEWFSAIVREFIV